VKVILSGGLDLAILAADPHRLGAALPHRHLVATADARIDRRADDGVPTRPEPLSQQLGLDEGVEHALARCADGALQREVESISGSHRSLLGLRFD
jgi:hypothetical protein